MCYNNTTNRIVGGFMDFIVDTTNIDLEDTPIENIFINDFMPMANGTYVKVYLLGYKYAYDRDSNIEADNETIAKHLDIPLDDVLRAWDFWEEKGIIEKLPKEDGNRYDYKVKFLSLKELYIKNNFRPVTPFDENTKGETKQKYYSCDVKGLIEANNSPAIQQMFMDIEYIIRRSLAPHEKQKILGWLCNYNMNPDVVVKAFFYSVEKKGINKINYVEGIVRNWYNDGVINVEALMEHFKAKDKRFYCYERIMKAMGFGSRCISEGERKVVDKWFDEYNFSLEMILKACENTSKTSNPSINYIDGILSSWNKKGIRTSQDIEEKDKKENRIPKKETNQNKRAVKTRFHNFEQRTEKYTSDELEEIARKKREKYPL